MSQWVTLQQGGHMTMACLSGKGHGKNCNLLVSLLWEIVLSQAVIRPLKHNISLWKFQPAVFDHVSGPPCCGARLELLHQEAGPDIGRDGGLLLPSAATASTSNSCSQAVTHIYGFKWHSELQGAAELKKKKIGCNILYSLKNQVINEFVPFVDS